MGRILIEHGADVNRRDHDGKTVLMVSVDICVSWPAIFSASNFVFHKYTNTQNKDKVIRNLRYEATPFSLIFIAACSSKWE